MPQGFLWVAILLIIGAFLAYYFKKLTVAGSITGAAIGAIIFISGGYSGITTMAFFFIAGTLATSWKKKQKYAGEKAVEIRRTAGQVWANAGAAAIISFAFLFIPTDIAAASLIAAAFSSATADTLSSELGTLYGSRFFNIITWKKDIKGLDGVISIEGLIIGVGGSAAIACIYCLFYQWDQTFFIIILAGTVGNLVDSVLGALLERKGRIKNDLVNFLNTVAAVVVAIVFLI